ncbi:MAG: class I SAM-dependent methyltransferase [Gordonibacter sp.]|uniref:class I SAM-dependent methyltransferase n=1 Tax=Gordonibacter sp. TaxID=1968902 RepID=UPI002FC97485
MTASMPDLLRATAVHPALYEKSPLAFWDDDHISAQMLANHLDPTHDGASRKHAFMDKSAAWIATALPPDEFPDLLDVGCGPGLYAERLARAGFNVAGIDLSRRSIAYARKSAQSAGLEIRYERQDYLELELNGRFDAAVMIYCDYGALSTQDRRTAMAHLHRHLKPGGRLLLDAFSLAHYRSAQENRTWEACPDGGFWSPHEHCVLKECRTYPPNVIMERYAVVEEDAVNTHLLWNTCFTAVALAEEACRAGFRVCGIFGDVAGSPASDKGDTVALLLEREG